MKTEPVWAKAVDACLVMDAPEQVTTKHRTIAQSQRTEAGLGCRIAAAAARSRREKRATKLSAIFCAAQPTNGGQCVTLMPRAASAPSIALLLAALVCAALAQGDGSACSAAYDGITVSETIIDSSLAGVVQLGPNGDVRILSSLRSSRWALLLVTTSIKISRGVSMSSSRPRRSQFGSPSY